MAGAYNLTFNGLATLDYGGGAIQLTLNNTGKKTTFAAGITQTGDGGNTALTLAGSGTLVLSGDGGASYPPYKGLTTINGGTMQLQNSGRLGGDLTINTGASFVVDETAGTSMNPRILSSATFTMNGGAFTLLANSGGSSIGIGTLALASNSGNNSIVLTPNGSGNAQLQANNGTVASGGLLQYTRNPQSTPTTKLLLNNINGSPPANNLLLPWATVNGSSAMYSLTQVHGHLTASGGIKLGRHQLGFGGYLGGGTVPLTTADVIIRHKVTLLDQDRTVNSVTFTYLNDTTPGVSGAHTLNISGGIYAGPGTTINPTLSCITVAFTGSGNQALICLDNAGTLT